MSAQSAVRWQRRKEARPAEIVAAALECFRERGFAATRLEDVAARAGVTKGTIYLYYPSKEDLFKAVVRGALVPNIERLEIALEEPAPAAELLQRFFTYFAEHIVPSPVSVIPKLVIAEAGNFPELARYYQETAVLRVHRLISSVLRRGIENGEFRPVDVDHVVFSVIAPLVLTLLWKHSLGQVDDKLLKPAALARAHLDLILHGLQATAAPRPAAPSQKRRSS